MAKKSQQKISVNTKKPVKAKPTKRVAKKQSQKKKNGKSPKGNDKVDLECFLSTACIQYKKLPDDCRQLELLRKFRDEHMKASAKGNHLVQEYYKLGPLLVKAIESDKNKKNTYRYIYSCILSACNKIVLQENTKAQMVYVKMVRHLISKYHISLNC